jgi:hypothetical protein
VDVSPTSCVAAPAVAPAWVAPAGWVAAAEVDTPNWGVSGTRVIPLQAASVSTATISSNVEKRFFTHTSIWNNQD